jgi:hypothetical protein
MSFEENVARLYEWAMGRPPSMFELLVILACINEARYGGKRDEMVEEKTRQIEEQRTLYEEAKANLRKAKPEPHIITWSEWGPKPDDGAAVIESAYQPTLAPDVFERVKRSAERIAESGKRPIAHE